MCGIDSKTLLELEVNQFGIEMGLKTTWIQMRDRFKDTFGIGSGINLEMKWV